MTIGPARKIAIVHDWLIKFAGSERVIREMMALYPDATLYSTIDFLSDSDREQFGGHRAKTTFAQRLPGLDQNVVANGTEIAQRCLDASVALSSNSCR